MTLPCTEGFDWAAAALSLSQILRFVLSGRMRYRGALVMIYLNSYFVWFSCWSWFCPSMLLLKGRDLDNLSYTHGVCLSHVHSSLYYKKFVEIYQRLATKTWHLSLVEKSALCRVRQSVRVPLNLQCHSYACDRQNSRDLSNGNVWPGFAGCLPNPHSWLL